MGIAELPSFEDRYYQMDGWVLVYSVTERRSFDVLSEIFDKLKVTINDKKHLPIVVVGNKIDLDGNRAVSVKEGQEFASSVRLTAVSNLCPWFLVDAAIETFRDSIRPRGLFIHICRT